MSSLDDKRLQNIAYEYLCHLEEAKIWLETNLHVELPVVTEFEDYMRTGVTLAQLGNFFAPQILPTRKIYDINMDIFQRKGLHFKYSDNIVNFTRCMESIGFPKIFYPETTDIYDKKNMPKLIYCLHALSLYLFKLGKAQPLKDLLGHAKFTEEQIIQMAATLQHYGVQMPAFSKIGGILAGELSENDAAMHAAILKINETIDTFNAGNCEVLIERMKNPDAQLFGFLNSDFIMFYGRRLKRAKINKIRRVSKRDSRTIFTSVELDEVNLNDYKNNDKGRSVDNNDTGDVYDSNLTQAEIRDILCDINVSKTLELLSEAVAREDSVASIKHLSSSFLKIPNVLYTNSDVYYALLVEELKKNLSSEEKFIFDVKLLESIVEKANKISSNQKMQFSLLEELNEKLDAHKLLSSTSSFDSGQFADEAGELVTNIINLCADQDSNFVKANKKLYIQALQIMKYSKKQGVIELADVRETVDFVNAFVKAANDSLLRVEWLNQILLRDENLPINNVTNESKKKALPLILDEGNNFKTVNQSFVSKMNSIDENQSAAICINLLYDLLGMKGLINELSVKYVQSLKETLQKRDFISWNGWVNHSLIPPKNIATDDAYSNNIFAYFPELTKRINNSENKKIFAGLSNSFLFNHKDRNLKLKLPSENNTTTNINSGYFNCGEIQSVINSITQEFNREQYLAANTPSVKFIQAFIRCHDNYLKWLKKPYAETIKSFLLALQHKVQQFDSMKPYVSNMDKLIILQQFLSTLNSMADYQRIISHYKSHMKDIVILQSLIRASQAHLDYNNLVHTDKPTCKAVSKFVRLLELDSTDLKEEKEIAQLRKLVLERIKEVNIMEQEVKDMDVKIGLLVKNRLQVQEVHLAKAHGKRDTAAAKPFSMHNLSKEKQLLYEKYGKLFYMLQTRPIYIARLLMMLDGNRTNKFIKETCYAMFNYGTNLREEYLLIKLFSKAMELEVETRIDSLQEFTRGDPMVIRMVIVYWRNSKAQTWLEEILTSVVKNVLNSKISLITNPVDIYKQWISKIETETGQASGYPYDVDNEKALSYPEVREKLQENIATIRTVCTNFIDAICSSSNKLPYGIRYIARHLYMALKKRFPNESEVNYFKVIANLLYYRLINPAVVTPDTFNIVTSAEITPEKRRNLANISAILQRAAMHNFSTDPEGSQTDNNSEIVIATQHHTNTDEKSSIDVYLKAAWDKFNQWYLQCIDVEDAEIHFNMDEFTDRTALSKPQLTLTIKQILGVHNLLLEHIDDITYSDDNEGTADPLLVMLKDIGEGKRPENFVEMSQPTTSSGAIVPLGGEGNGTSEATIEAINNLVIQLDLIAPEISSSSDRESRIRQLFYETMKMVVDIIHFEPGDNLGKILEKNFTEKQEEEFLSLQKKRNAINVNLEDGTNNNNKESEQSLSSTKFLRLSETRDKILENAKLLEEEGMCSSEDGYQALIDAIAKEIRNRRQYRKHRRYDLLRLRGALENLNSKNGYLSNQAESYNQYIKSVRENLAAKGKKKGTGFKKTTLKMNGQKLLQQGIVLEIDGLKESQFKNVVFEISNTEDVGVFTVSARLFGVGVDTIELVFQDLLQMQYENIAVLNLFDRAKLNVNLLVYTINKKFYSKK